MSESEDIIKHKHAKLTKLAEGNERSFSELRAATQGKFTMDTSDLRRELLIDKLLQWNVITEEQRLDYEIQFHETVESSLNDYWQQFNEARGPKLSVVKQPTKLVDQNGRPMK